MSSQVKVVAQYFPQLHAIAENDRWWGKGFTDWVNVRRSEPQFPGHRQPRVPRGGDYYDQSSIEVVRRQAELARAHGVDAFCHYHYWFDGTHLLQTPTDLLLANKDIDIQFCLNWANETWSRRWDGMDHHILIAQKHPPTVESWRRHFDCLIKYWLDERHMRIDGRPVFLIYRAKNLVDLPRMFEYFQTRASREYGLPGLYLVNVVQHGFPPWELLRHFDAAMLFQPFAATYSGKLSSRSVGGRWWLPVARTASRVLPRGLRSNAHRELERPRLYNYDEVWEEILAWRPERHLPVMKGAWVDWDNTPRYRNRATVYDGGTPEKFGRYMRRLLDQVASAPYALPFVFVNAWNEWAEGAYLEPDEVHGTAYLEALAAARGAEPAPAERQP